MLKYFTSKNQITRTKIILPTYHNTLCATSNQEMPVTKIEERKTILTMFIIKRDTKEIRINFNLFGNLIAGIDKLIINNK